MTGDVDRRNESQSADAGDAGHTDRMQLLNEAVRRFVRQAGWLLFARQAVLFAVCWAFAWGVMTLALRTTCDTPRDPLLRGGAGFALLLLALLFWPTCAAAQDTKHTAT